MIGCDSCLVLLVMVLPVRFWMVTFPLPGLSGRLLLGLPQLMLTVFLGGSGSCSWSWCCSFSCGSPWWSQGS